MALAPGTRLGPYEIAAQIGAGGMGEVYSATDTNLGRQVAVKVLREAFADGRLARFEDEAKTLASLNHPNIAAIFGVEKSQGLYALVMELVEGETLADRISRGPLPLDEALSISEQITAALAAAHGRGIAHRDLRPASIKLLRDRAVKVLDFGVAQLFEPDLVAQGESRAPTSVSRVARLTSAATGTAGYMSPEQVRGEPLDHRKRHLGVWVRAVRDADWASDL